MWENLESWLVYANKLFEITQPYFSTDIIKKVSASFFFLLLEFLTKKNKVSDKVFLFQPL